MAKSPEKPFFHVILSDRDEWVVEAEWSDSTLERVSTFGDYSAAADWIANPDARNPEGAWGHGSRAPAEAARCHRRPAC
jgi:hypothetical protein